MLLLLLLYRAAAAAAGFYIVYIVVFVAHAGDMDEQAAQRICCLFPPMALQIGAGAFLKSYDGIPISEINGLLVSETKRLCCGCCERLLLLLLLLLPAQS